MATEVVMPKLGLTMEEGTIENWFVNEGDEVQKGDPIAEISSEKLTSEVEAPADGTVIKLLWDVGDVVECKAPMAYIGQPGEQVDTGMEESKTHKVETSTKKVGTPTEVAKQNQLKHREDGERIFITPVARKMAEERGIDIRDVNGTGGNGRITRLDILRYVPSEEPVETEVASVPKVEYGTGLTGMRKTIAQRMMRSVQTTAQVTNQRKVDVTTLMEFRKEIKEKINHPLNNGELSVNTLLTRAVIFALQDSQEMNAWYHNGEYIQVDEIHIGMATAINDGLVVPVIKDAHLMSLSQLGKEIRRVTTAAREGTLDGNLYAGSTFSITNLGGYDIEYFTPIINTPEVAILGVGSIQTELELVNGEIVEKQKLPLSLTYDHQLIDGVPAAEFMSKIADYLQDPYRLLI